MHPPSNEHLLVFIRSRLSLFSRFHGRSIRIAHDQRAVVVDLNFFLLASVQDLQHVCGSLVFSCFPATSLQKHLDVPQLSKIEVALLL